MNKIQIKNYITGEVIYEHEEEENTIKKTVEAAVRDGANLTGADLSRANLTDADLSRANLTGAYLTGANLTGADLSRANLTDADLSRANLTGANLTDADLSRANLTGANLTDAYLTGAYLTGAYLTRADLSRAYLSRAYLTGANLTGANLTDAYLSRAYLTGAENIPFIPLACPSDGAFTGWKKVKYDGVSYLVELYIPGNARRSSATTNKCRCDKAKVISITRIDNGEEVERVTNRDHAVTTYEVGCMVTPDSFDEDRWNECSHGIHFFINKQEAINY